MIRLKNMIKEWIKRHIICEISTDDEIEFSDKFRR